VNGAWTHRKLHAPRYWPLWLGIGCLWLIARFPHPWQLAIGRGLGWLLFALARRRRHYATVNIALCFPELPPETQRRLVRDSFLSYGMSVIETGTAWLRGVAHLAERTEVVGAEHVRAALARGRGAVIVGAHFSTLDIAGALVAPHVRMDVIYRPSRNLLFDSLIRRGRSRYFGEVIDKKNTLQIARRLRSNHAVWYAADQDYGRRHSVFAPFFGIPAATIAGPSRLARLHGSPVIFCSHFRLDGGARYRINFSPILENFPGSDEAADAARINTLIEAAVREHPEQYLWLHRRFKTRPDPDTASPYARPARAVSGSG
jgi:KDO2-lipid IV(A) lauroyltransferase